MKVSGYRLREAIKRWELRRTAAAAMFDPSIYAFDDEQKALPSEVCGTFVEADDAIAKLQEAQARYNLTVVVRTPKEMTLCEAVKRIGGAGRVEKIWRSAATPKKDRYREDLAPTRNKEEVRAKRTITYEAALKHASNAAKVAGDLRAAIAQGNATEVDIETLDSKLFE